MVGGRPAAPGGGFLSSERWLLLAKVNIYSIKF
jgi:hypothetical protein